MALSTYALLSVAELKEHLGGLPGSAEDGLLESIINELSEDMETQFGRQWVTRGELTEYHTMRAHETALRTNELRTLQWPLISIVEIREDQSWPRTYPATSLLVVDTDFQIVKHQRDYVRRLLTNWPSGTTRPIRIKYTAGYTNTATVPSRVKAQAKRYGAALYRERERGTQGVLTQSDPLGNFTRFGAAGITQDMRNALAGETRVERFETGEAA